MDNIVKAKVLIELLDDRKYSVLSSFSTEELNVLNSVDLTVLNALTSTDINSVVGDFITTAQQHQDSMPPPEQRADSNVSVQQVSEVVKIEAPVTMKAESVGSIVTDGHQVSDDLQSKLQEQPPQVLAFILQHLSDEQHALVSSKLTAVQTDAISGLDIEQTPISEQVAQVILDDLGLSPLEK
jgi:hypothetical protein